MDTNKMRDISREQFEAWHRSVVEGEPPHEKYNSGDYRNQHVQRYWLGWQASREAVVVELPSLSKGNRPYNQGIYETKCRIEAQGLKVAP
ncbi:hypothetical protein [Pseudomonas monteilii]|uniref:hypothetical protein n=1 Tax=Pseudomonas monteilii TaxID=76759 RepID=UPI0007613C64|nr:hypothetical protein [Pseudomonas monteilii]